MPRVLRVCNVDEEGRFGGPERRIIQVALGLGGLGICTHIVYPKLESDRFEQEILSSGVEHTCIDLTRLTKEPKMLARYIYRFFWEIWILFRFFRRNQFDVIHVNGAYQLKTAISGKLSGIPVVWHLNNTYLNPILKCFFYVSAAICANGFIVAGKKVEEYYFRNWRFKSRPVLEIHAPVNTELFNPKGISHDSHVKYCEPNFYTVVTVSGVNPAKGLEHFLRMASNVGKSKRNLKFLIAGSVLSSQKRYSNFIFHLIHDLKKRGIDCRFVGHVENVPSFLAKADVCVFTSVREASPTSVWEAMSMGKPVVTTDVGSVGQYIENGVSGYVVPIKDAEALSGKVLMLLEKPDLRAKLGAEARKAAVSSLDIGSAAQKHSSIYKTIAMRKKSS